MSFLAKDRRRDNDLKYDGTASSRRRRHLRLVGLRYRDDLVLTMPTRPSRRSHHLRLLRDDRGRRLITYGVTDGNLRHCGATVPTAVTAGPCGDLLANRLAEGGGRNFISVSRREHSAFDSALFPERGLERSDALSGAIEPAN